MATAETPPQNQAEPAKKAALEYARGVHAEAVDTNKSLYARAQIVLTFDGVVVAAIAGLVASNPRDLERTLATFGATTWVGAGLAGVGLIVSLTASTMALYSRHHQGTKAADAAFVPAQMWFYRAVDRLEHKTPGRFVEVGATADEAFETRARLAQVATIAPIMIRRADWLNRAFVATAFMLVLFALTTADYVARVAD